MERNRRVLWIGALVSVVVILVAVACGAPSEQAAECTAGGSADEAVFAQHFSSMGFGGGAPSSGEGGQEFAPSEEVVVVVNATTETATRFCTQERTRVSTVGYDQTHTLPVGETRVSLGVFTEKGNYVARVSVGGTLVKNLTFTVQ